ncbi:MAG: LamG-like jellyroll fold domain-containing protein [Mesorhizobium sp.]
MTGLRFGLALSMSGRGRGRVGPPWSPASLFANGEQGLWLDPSDLSTLFQDDAGTTPVTSDGDPDGLTLDKSGNGNHASQATLASRLTYKTDGTLRWLQLDGVDDSLATSSFSWGSDEVTVVAGLRKTGGNEASGMLVELSNNRANNAGSFTVFAPATTTRYGFYARGSNAMSGTATTTSSTYDSPHTGVFTGYSKISTDTTVLRVNGAQIASSSQDLGSGNFGSYPLYIGRRGGSSNPFAGNIYGLVIVNRLLSAGELASLESWMADKTGVTW